MVKVLKSISFSRLLSSLASTSIITGVPTSATPKLTISTSVVGLSFTAVTVMLTVAGTENAALKSLTL